MAELARLTWPEAREAIRAASIGLLPVGAIEQHGPHLPLNTDLLIAHHVAARAADQLGALLLPAVSVGVSHEHIQFWGTLTIQPDQLRDLARSILRSCAEHGLRRFILVNGHGTNCAPLEDAARLLSVEGLPCLVFNWWQAVGSALASLSLSPVDHAGPVETSLLLAIDASLVRTERIPQAARGTAWGGVRRRDSGAVQRGAFLSRRQRREPGTRKRRERVDPAARRDRRTGPGLWLACRTRRGNGHPAPARQVILRSTS